MMQCDAVLLTCHYIVSPAKALNMIEELLERIYAAGCENDARAAGRDDMMFNITPATGRFLQLLVEEAKPRKIVEAGTSNGYSTIWLAQAAQATGAGLISVDHAAAKTQMAAQNLSEAGLAEVVDLRTEDAGVVLQSLPENSVDFLFLDTDRSKYTAWWPAIQRAMQWGTIVADNAISHAAAMEDFRCLVNNDNTLESVVLPVGKGQLSIRARG